MSAKALAAPAAGGSPSAHWSKSSALAGQPAAQAAARASARPRAQEEARAAEVALDLHVPELRSQRVDQEAARAVLVIAELKQRYDELHREQHARAEQRAGEALELAMAILLDAERA